MRTPAEPEAAFSSACQSGALMFPSCRRSESSVSAARCRCAVGLAHLERGEQNAPLLVHRGVSANCSDSRLLSTEGGERGERQRGGGTGVQAPSPEGRRAAGRGRCWRSRAGMSAIALGSRLYLARASSVTAGVVLSSHREHPSRQAQRSRMRSEPAVISRLPSWRQCRTHAGLVWRQSLALGFGRKRQRARRRDSLAGALHQGE